MDNIIQQTKICTRCHEVKPSSKDFFHADRNHKDGLMGICKECRNKAARKRQPIPDGHRRCSICKSIKPATIEHFYSSRERKGGLGYVCRACRKDYVQALAENRATAPEGYRKQCATCQAWKPANSFIPHPTTRDGISATCRDCVSAYGVANREEGNSRARKRYQTPKGRYQALAKVHIRDARKMQSVIGEVNYERILERDGYVCYICEQPIDPTVKNGLASLTFDHEKPLAGKGDRKGTHTEDNIHPAHKCCNSRKWVKLISEMTPFQRRGPID